MQIYLDPETVKVYKAYAKEIQQPFAVVVRSVLDNEIERLKEKLDKKNDHPTFSTSIQKLVQFSKQLKDHHPDRTNDELLYE